MIWPAQPGGAGRGKYLAVLWHGQAVRTWRSLILTATFELSKSSYNKFRCSAARTQAD